MPPKILTKGVTTVAFQILDFRILAFSDLPNCLAGSDSKENDTLSTWTAEKRKVTAVKTDCHVHMIGNGSNGSGCALRLHGTGRFFGRYMCRKFGIPMAALSGDLEAIYLNRLVEYVRSSALDAVFLLASDHIRDARGQVLDRYESLVVSNDYLLKVCRDRPELLPAVSIHPARPDALEELEKAHAGGSRLMKLLPNYHNVECSNPAYRSFWERMAGLRMVFLAHTGGELSLPNVNREGQNPKGLELPLQCGVTVVAAHCATRSVPWGKDYMESFLQLLDRFPNLYGDNSALTSPNRSYAIRRLLDSKAAARMVHGSDLPIPVGAIWLAFRGLISFSEARRLDAISNPLERDVQIKKSLGFSDESFTRLATLTGLAYSVR